jgi:hypothetical protein
VPRGLEQAVPVFGRDVGQQSPIGHDPLEYGDGGAELGEEYGIAGHRVSSRAGAR